MTERDGKPPTPPLNRQIVLVLWLMVKQAHELWTYTVEGEFCLMTAESCEEPQRVSGVFLSEILSTTILGSYERWEMLPSGFLRYCHCHANASAMTGCACVITNNRLIEVSMACQSHNRWWVSPRFCLDWHLLTQMTACFMFSAVWRGTLLWTDPSLLSLYMDTDSQETIKDKDHWWVFLILTWQTDTQMAVLCFRLSS